MVNSFILLKVNPFETGGINPDALIEEFKDRWERNHSSDPVEIARRNEMLNVENLKRIKDGLNNTHMRNDAKQLILSELSTWMFLNKNVMYNGECLIYRSELETKIGRMKDGGLVFKLENVQNADELKTYKIVKKEDYRISNVFSSTVSKMGTNDYCEWVNKKMDRVKELVTESKRDKLKNLSHINSNTGHKELHDLINTLLTQTKNSRIGTDLSAINSELTTFNSVLKNEETFKNFKKWCFEKPIFDKLDDQQDLTFDVIRNIINEYVAGKTPDFKDVIKDMEKYCITKGYRFAFCKTDGITCYFCGAIHIKDSNVESCNICGKPLYTTCPVCKEKTAYSNNYCSKGHKLPKIDDILSLEKNLNDGLKRGDYDSVKKTINELNKISTGPKSAVLKNAEEYIKKIEETEKILDKFESSKQYYAAWEESEKIIKTYPCKKITKRYKEYSIKIENIYKELDECKNKEKSIKLKKYALIYEQCVDYPGVLDYLKDNPPQKPESVILDMDKEGFIKISANMKVSDDIEFLILRSKNNPVDKETEADKKIETPTLPYKDKDLIYGVEYYYTVYTTRWGIISTKPAISKPITPCPDVKELCISSLNDGLLLSYTIPKECTGIVLCRKENSEPAGINDGHTKRLGITGSYLDKDATNKTITYHYLVKAEYGQNRSIPIYSQGIRVHAKPEKLPLPITDLTVQYHEGTYIAKTKEKDRIDFYAGPGNYIRDPGNMPFNNLKNSMIHIENTYKDGEYKLNIGKDKNYTVYPVKIFNGMTAIIGNGIHVCTLPPVSVNEITREDNNVSLSITWPKNCDKLTVHLDPAAYVDAPTGNEREYKYGNCKNEISFTITSLPQYVTLFTYYKNTYTEPLNILVDQTYELSATIKKIKHLLRDDELKLMIDVKNKSDTITSPLKIPTMILRGDKNYVPFLYSNGSTIEEFTDVELIDGRCTINLNPSYGNLNLSIFFKPEKLTNQFKLHHSIEREDR